MTDQSRLSRIEEKLNTVNLQLAEFIGKIDSTTEDHDRRLKDIEDKSWKVTFGLLTGALGAVGSMILGLMTFTKHPTP